MKRASMLLILTVVLLASLALADEGMWMLHQIRDLNIEELKALGLELAPEEIFDNQAPCLAKAVVNLGGGTATFVSPDGLLLTNHHVAFAALQRQASVADNFIRDGFWAKTRSREVPAKGYLVLVLHSYEEVTDSVLKGVTERMTPLRRYQAIEKNIKALIEACEKGTTLRCEVAAAFEGLRYDLFRYTMIRDVRVVYAPPEMIGSFGGEIDNWMWPRHAGDFAFMRAYVAPDGVPAEYDENNVPYRPETWLPLSTRGLQEGQFTMVMGNPYSTERYRSSFATEDTVRDKMPWKLDIIYRMIAQTARSQKQSEEVKIILASRMGRLQNYQKYLQGVLAGLQRVNLPEQKRQKEEKALQALTGSPKKQKAFKRTLADLSKLYEEEYAAFKQKELVLDWMTYFVLMPRFAVTINKLSLERQKPDLEREPDYMERNLPLMKTKLKTLQQELHIPNDKQYFLLFIQEALKLPPGQRIQTIDQALDAGPDKMPASTAIEAWIDELYQGSNLAEEKTRLAMFDMDRDFLLETNDSLIAFAVQLEKELQEVRDRQKAFEGALSRLRPKYIQGLLAGSPGPAYPDANGTMRFSHGRVKGYSPRDAVNYHWMTSASGILEKHTGQEPFDTPEPLRKAIADRDYGPYLDAALNDVPVDFLDTNDTTGGNSGSAVLNGKGEIVGLLFDGNFEAMTSDYTFHKTLTRSISVDIRYVLFVLDKVYHVENVLKELTIH